MESNPIEYCGFWRRSGATIVDLLLLLCLIFPLQILFYGWDEWNIWLENDHWHMGKIDMVLQWILPAVVTLCFWNVTQATPGKMAQRIKIVDAETGAAPSTRQYIVRYLGYFVASLPLGIGILWVAIDSRKRGWHDMLAGTVVVRSTQPDRPNFESAG